MDTKNQVGELEAANYRDTNTPERCGNCMYYFANSRNILICQRYQTPVDVDKICNNYQAAL